MSPWSEAIGAKIFKGLQRCSPFLHIIHANLPLISFIYILRGLTSGVLYIYPMSLFSRIFSLLVFLAAFAEAVEVQVLEGDADGVWNLSAKKLRAMAAVYLAELGHVPSSENKAFAVSFSASGQAKRTIQMKKILSGGNIEEDSVVTAGMDAADDAVETLLTKSFGTASVIYKSERPSKVFIMAPEFIDIDDSMARPSARNMETALGELGFELAENDYYGTRLQMFLVKLKDVFWLGMIRMEGSKVVKGAHKKFMPSENLQTIIFSLANKVMNQDVRLEGSDVEVRDYADTHEAKCRTADGAESVAGFFAGLTADLLCELSDYLGLEVAVGSKDLYDDWYPNIRFALVWGFSDYHSWLWELDYAGTMGQTQSRWAFESVHRFSQRKGLFVDIVWGGAYDRSYKGWFLGGDIGYNLLASSSKSHWLSLMLRYDWTLGKSFSNSGRVSVNLVYDLRGYYSD